jgi:glycosyltransferase involved in cell wall biosynthesis
VAQTVLVAGRLHPYKRVDRVLEAFALVPAPARLVVLGDGPAGAELRSRAAGLGGRAGFEGTVSRDVLGRWLATADVYVSLSEQEAFGIGVAEGAAAGARVVASDIAAHREIAALAPGRVDLVPAGAVAADVAGALRRALAAGRPAGAPHGIPSWDEVATRTAAVYEEAVRCRG